MNEKKLIVLIDDYFDLRETIKFILEEKGFEVADFRSFEDALSFMETRKPELIISDLIGHENMNGVEFYINHIMEKKIKFALWSGSVDLKHENRTAEMDLFLEGMPKDFRVSYDPNTALDQKHVDLIVEDFKRDTKVSFPAFSKLGNIEDILKYFNLNNMVFIYFGVFMEAAKLSHIV